MGMIFDIKEMALHDGPGLRTTVFLKGCPLRCVWCHNPEGLSAEPQLYVRQSGCTGCGLCRRGCLHADCQPFGRCLHVCPQGLVTVSGREMSGEQLAQRILRGTAIADGVTFSGGEPLMQADFIAPVMEKLKAEGVHIAIETSLCMKWKNIEKVIGLVDLFFVDIKCVTPEKHMEGVGADNRVILENIRRLSETGADLILRTPVVPGFNADGYEIGKIGGFICSLPGSHKAELLAYHGMCSPKYAALGRKFPCEGTREPDRDEMEKYTRILTDMGIDAKYSM